MSSWNDLVVLQTIRCANDRAWSFFLPVFIAHVVSPTTALSTTAFLYAISCFASIMLVPLFASLWKPSRALSFAAVENVSLVGSGVVLYSFNGDNTNLLICAAIFVSVEKAASRTLTSVIEKQQTVIQSQSSRELSRANASLVRLDLIVAAFAPFAVNYIVLIGGHRKAVVVLVALQLMLSVITLPTALRVARLSVSSNANRKTVVPAATVGTKRTHVASSSSSPSSSSSSSSSFPASVTLIWDSACPCAYILAANALLYFTVVSPNGIMLVFLQNAGLSKWTVALVSSLGQLAGIVGSFCSPLIIEKIGLHHGGMILLTGQIVCVGFVAGVIVTYSSPTGTTLFSNSVLFVVCCLTVLSRVCLWAVDLVFRQIIQQQTPHILTAVFGFSDALTQCVSLCMYVCVSMGSFDFSQLVMASTFSLVLGWCCVAKNQELQVL